MPCLNEAETLAACIEKARLGLERAGVPGEVLIADNGSTDGSVAFVREHFGHDSRVEYLELPENLGWSGGNNAGMRRALEAGAPSSPQTARELCLVRSLRDRQILRRGPSRRVNVAQRIGGESGDRGIRRPAKVRTESHRSRNNVASVRGAV